MLPKGLVTILAVDLLMGLVAIPLIRRRVPPNLFYGFRTPTTLGDPAVWYETNAHFGRGLLAASLVSAIAIVALFFLEGGSQPGLLLESLTVLVGPFLVATVRSWRFSRSLKGPSGAARPG